MRTAKVLRIARIVFPLWTSVATYSCPRCGKSVEAMGGNLYLVAEFPDREPVVLSGIAEVEP